MDEIDKTIDMMNLDQSGTAFAKSKAKRNQLNIRYMSANQKDSRERADSIYGIFEKLLKDMLKIWLKDEKTVRLKYLKTLDERRRKVMIKTLYFEMEVVFNQMIKENLPDYENLGEVPIFEEKLKATRESLEKEIEVKTSELKQKINEELSQSGKMEPGELVKRYGIDEYTLIDLRLIKPLQDINVKLDKWMEGFAAMCRGVHETIALCSKYYQKGALKNIVLTIQTLVDQVDLDPEVRNKEVVEKAWNRLINLLKLAPEAEERIEKIQPLYKVFGVDESP